MPLDRVTITGADDGTDINRLFDLSVEFPFVEWGILVSDKRTGTARYPSAAWIENLQETAPKGVSLSLHVCGHWSYDLLKGVWSFPEWLLAAFDRIQLNLTHGQPCNAEAMAKAIFRFLGDRQLIFTTKGRGNRYLDDILGLDWVGEFNEAVTLFDPSGGRGLLASWPAPKYRTDGKEWAYHGYAGGLRPSNLAVELQKIILASKGSRIWIDLESGVRSGYQYDNFDIAKVRQCLEIAKPIVNNPS